MGHLDTAALEIYRSSSLVLTKLGPLTMSNQLLLNTPAHLMTTLLAGVLSRMGG